MRRFDRFVLLSVFLPLAVQAQTFGELSGTVTDSTNSMVAKARVRVLSAATNQIRTAETSDEGYYRVPFLPPGEYEVTVEQEGFKKVTRRGVLIQVDVPARLNIELTVGQVPVMVTSAA